MVGGSVDGGLVDAGLVDGGLVAGGPVGAAVGAPGDGTTPGCADGAVEDGDGTDGSRAGRVVAGPAPVGVGEGSAPVVRDVVVGVDAFARGAVVTGVVAPDEAQAAARSPPATTSAIDRTRFLMRSFLTVRGPDRRLADATSADATSAGDYRDGARIVHPAAGPTGVRRTPPGRSGPAGGADRPRWRPMTASRLGRPAPSPTITSAITASATLNS